jgi:hypothetical protein
MLKLFMKYKGNRNYIQGGDFFDAISSKLIEETGAGALKKLCFKAFTKNQCYLVLEKRPVDGQCQIGNGIWLKPDGEEVRFWIVESNEPVSLRYPFDEDELVAPSRIVGNAITLAVEKSEYSVIENVVALTKKLNYALTPDVNGKWVFGQLDMWEPMPTDFNEIEIIRTSERKGMFSRNEIVIDKEPVGQIRFIVGQP